MCCHVEESKIDKRLDINNAHVSPFAIAWAGIGQSELHLLERPANSTFLFYWIV